MLMNLIYIIMPHVVANNYGIKSLIPFSRSGVSNSAPRTVSGERKNRVAQVGFYLKSCWKKEIIKCFKKKTTAIRLKLIVKEKTKTRLINLRKLCVLRERTEKESFAKTFG